MTERLPFQYVVLRCVPRVDREEFLNVGVLLYCQAVDYLGCASQVIDSRLLAVATDLDLESVRSALAAIEAVCRGDAGIEAGRTSLGQRFGWLAAPRSTMLQPGPVHGGLAADPDIELARLVDMLVR